MVEGEHPVIDGRKQRANLLFSSSSSLFIPFFSFYFIPLLVLFLFFLFFFFGITWESVGHGKGSNDNKQWPVIVGGGHQTGNGSGIKGFNPMTHRSQSKENDSPRTQKREEKLRTLSLPPARSHNQSNGEPSMKNLKS